MYIYIYISVCLELVYADAAESLLWYFSSLDSQCKCPDFAMVVI